MHAICPGVRLEGAEKSRLGIAGNLPSIGLWPVIYLMRGGLDGKEPVMRAWTLVVFAAFRSAAAFGHPGSGIAVDEKGRIYFTDTGKGVWRIDADGKLTLISESAMHWMAIDRKGAFSNSPEQFGEWFGRLSPKGKTPTLISCSDFPCVVGAPFTPA